MNRDCRDKAIADAEFAYYESIARLIVDNPTVTLSDLRRQHHITQHEMSRAQEMFRVHRQTGKGSQAYKKPVSPKKGD
jgi:hypothetical protein